tara:strand:- start:501 stop:1016 length:516 start_codon:yes stop_codon:yes gene_type:complete
VTDDKDNGKQPGKLIIFPQNRIKKRITKPQESPFAKRLKEQQTREFIELTVDEIGYDLLRKFVDMGLKTTKENFTKDLALIIDCIRGLIYRDFDMAHAAQLMANKMVIVRRNKGGQASSAKIDYSDFMKQKPNAPKNVFNKGFTEELNDLQEGSDMFESDIDLNGNGDDEK